ncbi:MAG: hypothetical protein J6Y91_05305 [Alphaproteobacteria bacterium]|nr:hypothetical protein [Alphaproteobacteria bacterium]
MKKFDIFRILKLLCMILCAVFLLSACGDQGVCSGSSASTTEASAEKAGAECWQKSMLEVFYKFVGNMALNSYKTVTTENLLVVMVTVFTAWMAFQILSHVASTSPESIGEFWNKIIRKAALCFVCGTLASSTDGLIYTINTFIFPIYMTLLEFASRILDITNAQSSNQAIYIDGGEHFSICETFKHVKSGGCTLAATNVKFSASSFPQQPLDLMGCMACAVSDRLNVGYSIAMRLFCFDSVIAFVVAVLLVAGFTIAKICFALYLVDSIFRMDMMLIVLPFLILFFPFEQTRKWTAVGFKYILNSAAIMLCLVLIVSMTIMAMERILVSPAMGIDISSGKLSDLGTVPISIMFLAFVIVKASGMAVTLSNSVTGGSGETRFQKKIKAVVGTVAKMAFELITWGGGKAVTAVINHVERLRMIAEKVKKAKQAASKARSAMNRLAGRK